LPLRLDHRIGAEAHDAAGRHRIATGALADVRCAGSAAILTEDEAAPAKVMLVADIYPVDASGDRGTQLIQLSGWSS
jgi:hypothetical protein